MNYENFESYELLPEIAQEFSNEMYEAELANELLNVQSEEELNHFLGNLIKGAWRGAKNFYNSSAGQALKNQVIAGAKSIGRKALPSLGSAVGGYFGGSAGAKLGNQFGDWAAGRFLNEMEMETAGGDQVDNARRLIQMVRRSSGRIAHLAQSGQPLNRNTVHGVILQAAKQSFPSWIPDRTGPSYTGGGASAQTNTGTWYRQGNQIILSGV